MVSQNSSSVKRFHKILFYGSLEISLYTDRDADRGKVTYT